jgi:hypothetical protein
MHRFKVNEYRSLISSSEIRVNTKVCITNDNYELVDVANNRWKWFTSMAKIDTNSKNDFSNERICFCLFSIMAAIEGHKISNASKYLGSSIDVSRCLYLLVYKSDSTEYTIRCIAADEVDSKKNDNTIASTRLGAINRFSLPLEITPMYFRPFINDTEALAEFKDRSYRVVINRERIHGISMCDITPSDGITYRCSLEEVVIPEVIEKPKRFFKFRNRRKEKQCQKRQIKDKILFR